MYRHLANPSTRTHVNCAFTRLLLPVALISAPSLHAQTAPAFHAWAERPVMGWNSWDFYGTSINETKTRQQADYMADNLLPYGWNLITVDIQWYEPNATGFNYNANATLVMDQWGRLTPATNRFPSAADGAGFKPLADYVHSKGLKFGIHMMRGIPRQAWQQDLPVKGTAHTARDIADVNSTCSWNPDMYGVDMTKPGAQAYYDSIMELVASWEVDFVKIDDLSRPYHLKEIEGIRKAIDKTGRPIVLSTSPGETPVDKGAHVMDHANQWRISDDFWDNWNALYDQFQRLHDWTPYRGPGHFPDADMLPLGKIQGGSNTAAGRVTNFTANEQYTLMSLWAIARSPLIHGGDMTQMDPFTLSLLTNDEVIALNQQSTHNRQLFRSGDLVAWTADAEGSTDKYLAVFNTGGASANVPVTLSAMGFSGAVQIRSLWDQAALGSYTDTFSPFIASHAAALYRLSGTSVPVPWITHAAAQDGQVTLAWEAIASATTYRVKRATAEAGPYTVIAEGLGSTAFTDFSVQNGSTYHYAVSAVIDGQETPDSGSRSATPLGAAQIVGWNYDRFGTVSGNAIAGVVPAANWNNSWPDNPLTNLIDSSGAPTTLDISYSSFNTWSIQGSTPALDSDGKSNKRLLNGYLNAGNAAWGPPVTRSSVTLSEIPHGYYDLIVYFSSDQAGREGEVSDGASTRYFSTLGAPSIAGGNALFVATEQTTSDSYPAANHTVFRGLSGSSKTVSVQMRDNEEWGGIAAIQIVPQTDPLAATRLDFEMQSGGTAALLSWPADLGAVLLEESGNLSDWEPVDPQPETNSITVPVAAGPRFYRLNRP
jgi:alpha-galactosidase